MLIIGCDYHPRFQQIAFVDTATAVTGPSSRDIRSQIAFHSLQTGADLYSAFTVQRILEGLGSNRLGMSFSGTGRGYEFAQKAAKSTEKCELKYRLLTIRDLLAERGGFEPPIQLLTV